MTAPGRRNPPEPLLHRLRDGEILVGDSAIGSMLIAHGLQPGRCPELITLEEPEILAAIARRYLAAGGELLTTNTFGASPLKLSDYELMERTEELNRAAVAILREVAAGNAYVSASCGPSGKILKPYGDTDEDDLYRSFERQLGALDGADVVCIETMSDLREAALAVRAAKAALPKTPVMATMTFDQTKRGFFTIMGNTLADAAAGLEDAGADVVGSNCGDGIEKMISIAGELAKVTSLPILIQANAGQPVVDDGVVSYPETPEFFFEKTADLIEAGTSIIGGCCGSTPDHIRSIRQAVDDAPG
jgi:5-methyltetrahydrofolate--homocysteine methyltransferase